MSEINELSADCCGECVSNVLPGGKGVRYGSFWGVYAGYATRFPIWSKAPVADPSWPSVPGTGVVPPGEFQRVAIPNLTDSQGVERYCAGSAASMYASGQMDQKFTTGVKDYVWFWLHWVPVGKTFDAAAADGTLMAGLMQLQVAQALTDIDDPQVFVQPTIRGNVLIEDEVWDDPQKLVVDDNEVYTVCGPGLVGWFRRRIGAKAEGSFSNELTYYEPGNATKRTLTWLNQEIYNYISNKFLCVAMSRHKAPWGLGTKRTLDTYDPPEEVDGNLNVIAKYRSEHVVGEVRLTDGAIEAPAEDNDTTGAGCPDQVYYFFDDGPGYSDAFLMYATTHWDFDAFTASADEFDIGDYWCGKIGIDNNDPGGITQLITNDIDDSSDRRQVYAAYIKGEVDGVSEAEDLSTAFPNGGFTDSGAGIACRFYPPLGAGSTKLLPGSLVYLVGKYEKGGLVAAKGRFGDEPPGERSLDGKTWPFIQWASMFDWRESDPADIVVVGNASYPTICSIRGLLSEYDPESLTNADWEPPAGWSWEGRPPFVVSETCWFSEPGKTTETVVPPYNARTRGVLRRRAFPMGFYRDRLGKRRTCDLALDSTPDPNSERLGDATDPGRP